MQHVKVTNTSVQFADSLIGGLGTICNYLVIIILSIVVTVCLWALLCLVVYGPDVPNSAYRKHTPIADQIIHTPAVVIVTRQMLENEAIKAHNEAIKAHNDMLLKQWAKEHPELASVVK